MENADLAQSLRDWADLSNEYADLGQLHAQYKAKLKVIFLISLLFVGICNIFGFFKKKIVGGPGSSEQMRQRSQAPEIQVARRHFPRTLSNGFQIIPFPPQL